MHRDGVGAAATATHGAHHRAPCAQAAHRSGLPALLRNDHHRGAAVARCCRSGGSRDPDRTPSRAMRTCNAPVGPSGPPTKRSSPLRYRCAVLQARRQPRQGATHHRAPREHVTHGSGLPALLRKDHHRCATVARCCRRGGSRDKAPPTIARHAHMQRTGRAFRPSYKTSITAAQPFRAVVGAAAAATRRHTPSHATRTCNAWVGPSGPPTRRPPPQRYRCAMLQERRKPRQPSCRCHSSWWCRSGGSRDRAQRGDETSVGPSGPPTRRSSSQRYRCAVLQERRQPRPGATR